VLENFLENKLFSLSEALNLIPAASCLTNKEGILLFANPTFTAYFGHQKLNDFKLFNLSINSHSFCLAQFIEVNVPNQSKPSIKNIVWLQNDQNEMQRFEVSCQQFEVENKNFLIWNFHPIEFILKNQQVYFQNENYILKTESGSFLCHEINNVLASILAKISLLKRKLSNQHVLTQEEHLEFLNKIETSNLKISNHIKTFRANLRNDDDDPQEPLPIGSLLKQIYKNLSESYPIKEDALLFPKELKSSIILNVRPIQLQECLQSLILFLLERSQFDKNSNSIVNLEMEELEGSKIKFILRVNKLNLSEEDLAKWEQPFYQIASFKGSNHLNLSLCKKIIEKSSGRLSWSHDPAGFCFIITL
jgi:signal transduction histidine kinase